MCTDQTATTQVFNSSVALGNGNVNDCVILGANVTVPWDNPHNLISLQTSMMIENVRTLLFLPLLFAIGLTTNVLNAVVFARQGLSERINMCLFTLSLTDLACVSCMMAMSGDAIYMKVTSPDSPTVYLDYRPVYSYFVNNNLLGLYGLFSASSFLNVVISTERCVCVLFPFRAKKCVPTKALAAVLATLIPLLIGQFFVVTKQYVYQCFYEVVTDRVTWRIGKGEYFFKHRAMLETISIFYGFGLAVSCPVVVCVTTLITSVKLYRVITWRKTTSSLSSSSATSVSAKEVAVTRMLICVSTEFVAFSILGLFIVVAPFLQPRLSAGGLYANVFRVLAGWSDISFMASSSLNFFVYYFAGTRFRDTIKSFLCGQQQKAQKQTPSIAASCGKYEATELSTVLDRSHL
jgi:hypothetical protein